MPGFHARDSKCRSVSHRSQPAWFVFICAATVGITVPAMAQARVSVDRPDQLPAHVYRVSMPVSKLLSDDSAFARLVREVRENAEADLRTYDIRDRTTLGGYYSSLESVALAQGRWEAALAYIDSARSVQDKAASRLLFGLLERPLIAAKRGDPATYRATYATALKRELDALPYDSVDAGLKSRRGGIDGDSPALLIRDAEQQFDPASIGGSIPHAVATTAIHLRNRLHEFMPLRDVIVEQLSAVIAAHPAVKTDIWAAREVTLGARDRLTPVTVAIWARARTSPCSPDVRGRTHDKYGVDVDDIYEITDILPGAMKEKYAIRLFPSTQNISDELHVGYLKMEKLANH